MRSTRYTILFVFSAILLMGHALPANAQFGRNKVQYKDYKWQVLTTPHFRIHFYQGGESFAVRAGLVLEDGYQMLSERLNTHLPWKVPVILYSNHNDFLQTNVSLQMLSEGVQAFAEPSRKRIVLPFTGSFPAFAHTAIHELAHVFTFQIVYNRLLDNVFSRNALFGMPLWIAEGVAEYLAVGWDEESDMYIRDGVIHDYLGDLNYSSGFAVYKQGQSVFNYIADTYGHEKVIEILDALAVTRNADGALEKTIGLSASELSVRWKKAMRKRYWPLVADKVEVEEIGRRLTNHVKNRAYYNTKPVLSPDGEKIAFFSDRDGLISIYIMSTLDGKVIKKLVSGHRSNRFESLHFFTSSLSWSPDGKNITFIAKSSGRDYLVVVDAKRGKEVKRFDVRADGLASPDWSPLGSQIVVSAVFGGQTDLVIVDVEAGSFERVTFDVADQLNPRFFPDGKRIAYEYYPETTAPVPPDLSNQAKATLAEMDFLAKTNLRHGMSLDIYELDLETRRSRMLVGTAGDDASPVVLADGSKMIFTSDVSGTSNLFVLDLETGRYKRITDVLGGIATPDVNQRERRITFSSFVQSGWDIYVSDELHELLEQDFGGMPQIARRAADAGQPASPLLDSPVGGGIGFKSLLGQARPDDDDSGTAEPEGGVFSVSRLDSIDLRVLPRAPADLAVTEATGEEAAGQRVEGMLSPVSADEPKSKGASVSKYKLRLAPDFIGQGGGLYFSTGVGWGLANTIAMSDMLGNHRAVLSFNLFRDIADSDIVGTYYYLKHRTNYGIGAFQFKNFLNSRVTTVGESFRDYRLFTERNYGIFGLISFPFNTFNRVDLELQAFVSERQFFDEVGEDAITGQTLYEASSRSTRNLIEPKLSFVHDASFFSYFGPVDGSRWIFSVSKGFGVGDEAVDRATVYLDYRKYFRLFYRNSFAFRLAAAASEGEDPRTFFLGGPFSVRGYDYLDFEGSRLALMSMEYRFPMIDALILGWPGRWGFQNLGGLVFFDIGAAWDNNELTPIRHDVSGIQLQDLKADFGIGTHFYFGYFLLNFQVAWQTDLRSVQASKFHFFIGPNF